MSEEFEIPGLESFIAKAVEESTPKETPFIFRYHPDGYILPSPGAQARLAFIRTLDEDSCMSFHEWKLCKHFVKKGAKSHFKDILGIPQFTKEQVEKSRW
jgi:hypothetical protein